MLRAGLDEAFPVLGAGWTIPSDSLPVRPGSPGQGSRAGVRAGAKQWVSLPEGERSRSPPTVLSHTPSEHPLGLGTCGSQHPCAFHAWRMTVALEEHGSSLPMTGKSVWERFWWKSLGQHRLPAQHCWHMAHMGVSLAVPWQLLPSPRAESGGPGCSQASWLQSGQAGTGERASKGSLALTFL